MLARKYLCLVFIIDWSNWILDSNAYVIHRVKNQDWVNFVIERLIKFFNFFKPISTNWSTWNGFMPTLNPTRTTILEMVRSRIMEEKLSSLCEWKRTVTHWHHNLFDRRIVWNQNHTQRAEWPNFKWLL